MSAWPLCEPCSSGCALRPALPHAARASAQPSAQQCTPVSLQTCVPSCAASHAGMAGREAGAPALPYLVQSEPYVVEALFPLFELLHHYWINQADRDSCLQVRGRWGRVSRPPRGLQDGRIRPPRHHRLPVQWAWHAAHCKVQTTVSWFPPPSGAGPHASPGCFWLSRRPRSASRGRRPALRHRCVYRCGFLNCAQLAANQVTSVALPTLVMHLAWLSPGVPPSRLLRCCRVLVRYSFNIDR